VVTPQSTGTELARMIQTFMDITIAHQLVLENFLRKMNVMLVVVTMLEYGALGMNILVMLNVVMETDVAPGLANRIPTVQPHTLTAHQSATDQMKTTRNATQDAVTRMRNGLLGLTGSAPCPAAMVQTPDIGNASTTHTTQTLSAQRDAEMETSTRHETATLDVVNRTRNGLHGATGNVM